MHVVAPVVTMAAGALLVLRPVLPAIRPIRAGAVCLFAALALGLTAGTFGMGPGGEHLRNFDVPYAKEHGGMAGEALYAGITAALGTVGAHIVCAFLFVAAALLLTGASVASVIQATSDTMTASTRRVRSGADSVTRTVARRRVGGELEQLERSPSRVTAVARTHPEPAHALPDVLGDAEDLAVEEPFWPEAEIQAGAVPREPEVAPEPEPFEPAPEPEPADAAPDDPPGLSEDEDQPGVEKLQPDQLDLTPQGRL